MNQNAITVLEKELVTILKEEYTFYQSLYIVLDKQRDAIKYNQDEHLLDMYSEIERCQRRIRESEEKIEALKDRDERLFKLATVNPEIKRLVTSIVTLVRKTVGLIQSNEKFLRGRHERIRQELEELKNSRKILQYMSEGDPKPQFVDDRK